MADVLIQVYPVQILNTYHRRPVDTGHVAVWRGWLTKNPEDKENINQLATQDYATTVAEDIRLVESVHRRLKSCGYSSGPLVVDPNGGVSSEHSEATLHQWMGESFTK